MSAYQSSLWSIELLPNWTASTDGNIHTIERDEGNGALQISVFTKKRHTITEAELLDDSELKTFPRHAIAKHQWGDFHGFQVVFSADARFWRKWWLTDGNAFMFVTYNCDLESKDRELQDMNTMLSSLKSNVEPNDEANHEQP